MAPKDPQALSLTPADLRAIVEAVSAAVNSRHECRFSGIPEDKTSEVVHAIGMITDLGKGSMREGIEVLRDNHKAMVGIRARVSQVAMGIGMAVILGITSGIVAACWIGVKAMAVVHGTPVKP